MADGTSVIFGSTVVGSFPLSYTRENMERAFKAQIDAGITFPCYPQLVSMVDQFLGPLTEIPGTGIVKKEGRYYLEGEFEPPAEVPEEILKYGEFVLKFLDGHPDYASKIKGWKACLTGPFTLAGEILIPGDMLDGRRLMVYSEPRAIMVGDLVRKLADFMANVALEYNRMGATIISMDEPTLTLIVGRRKIFFYKKEEIVEILNSAIRQIGGYSSIHICGNVSAPLRDILLSTDVNIVDHEFANGYNVGLFEPEMLESSGKILAYGSVVTAVASADKKDVSDYIESLDWTVEHMERGIAMAGPEHIMFKPDCGFGGLKGVFGEERGFEIAVRKMEVMTRALEIIKERYS